MTNRELSQAIIQTMKEAGIKRSAHALSIKRLYSRNKIKSLQERQAEGVHHE